MAITCTVSDTAGIASGDAVCVVDWDSTNVRPKVARATASALATSKTVFGVCVSSATNGSPVFIAVAGDCIPVAVTGLSTGAGSSKLVVTDFDNATSSLQCRLRHIDDSTSVPEKYVVGTSDEHGDLTIQPRHASLETGFVPAINVRAYGAVGDGTTDDSTAIANAAAAVPSGGGMLVFPGGATYAVASNLTLAANVHVIFQEGAIISAAGAKVTINGRITCHPTQKIFAGQGTLSAVTQSGSGPTVTAAITGQLCPLGDYSAVVRIRTGGARGASTFEYSLDGGTTFAPDAAPFPLTSATFVLPGSGVTLSFTSGTYVAGTTYSFTTTTPLSIAPQTFEELSVMNFGAVPDGTTDNTLAFTATIRAISATPTYTSAVINVPRGTYHLASNLDITRHIILRGAGAAWPYNESVLDLAAGASLIVHCTGTSPEPSTRGAAGTVIENLRFKSSLLAFSLPQTPPTPDMIWYARTPYAVGAQIRRVDDNRFYQEVSRVTGSGPVFYSGTTPPAFSDAPFPITDLEVPDGDLFWTTKAHSAVIALHRCVIRDCVFENFTNAAVTLYGLEEKNHSNVSGSWMSNSRMVSCGIGVLVRGSDANVCLFQGLDAETAGYAQLGVGGHGFYDESALGSTWVSCQSAVSTGAAIKNQTAVGYSTFVGCYTEGGLPAEQSDIEASLVLGGDHGSGFTSTSNDSFTGFVAPYWHNLGSLDSHDAQRPRFMLFHNTNRDYLQRHVQLPGNPEGNLGILAERFETQGLPRGWWITGIAGTADRPIIGYSHSQAKEGAGHFRVFNGEFRGPEPSPYFVAYSNSEPDALLWARAGEQGLGGHLKAGDRIDAGGSGTPGTALAQVVTTEGWIPYRTWAPGLHPFTYDLGSGGLPTVSVRPTTPNGFVYASVAAGTTGGASEPTWPTSYLGSGGIVPYRWYPGLPRKIGDYCSPSTRNGHFYKVTAQSSPNASGYSTGGGVEPTWPMTSGGTVVDGNLTWTEQGSDVGTYVSDGTNDWQCVGPEPKYAPIFVVEDANRMLQRQSTIIWADTPGTDPSSTAPKVKERSRRRQFQTTTATANQVIENGLSFGGEDFTLPEDAVTTVEVLLQCKRSGSTDAASIVLEGYFYRNGSGAPARIDIDDAEYKVGGGLATLTADLHINGNAVEVRVSPPSAMTLDWSILRSQWEGMS